MRCARELQGNIAARHHVTDQYLHRYRGQADARRFDIDCVYGKGPRAGGDENQARKAMTAAFIDVLIPIAKLGGILARGTMDQP